jgi:hypothetical protein
VIFSAAVNRAAARKVRIISAPVGDGKRHCRARGQTIPGQRHRLAIIQVGATSKTSSFQAVVAHQ